MGPPARKHLDSRFWSSVHRAHAGRARAMVDPPAAWISHKSGRTTFDSAKTAVPGDRDRARENSRREFAISRRSPPPRRLETRRSSSVGPKRFLTARKMRNWCEPFAFKESTASTRCSTPAARDLTVFRDVPTYDHASTRRWRGGSTPLRRSRAPLRHRAGWGASTCRSIVWIDVDD